MRRDEPTVPPGTASPPIPPLLRASDVADVLLTTESNVYILAKKGVLLSVRFKTGIVKKKDSKMKDSKRKDRETVRFRREDVERFIVEHLHGNGAKR